MKNKIKIMFGLILPLIIATSIMANEVQLTASVSNNEVPLNSRFTYTVAVSGSSGSLPTPSFPDFNKFMILSGPNTSSNYQWVNGVTTSTKSYAFILQPKELGRHKIEAAQITHQNKTLKSNEIVLSVVKGQNAGANQSQKSTKRFNDPQVSNKDIFFRTQTSKKKAYVGEQILIEYKLYFRVNIRDHRADNIPSNTGFWAEDLKVPGNSNEVVNGVQYNVATILKQAIFPTHSGTFITEPLEMTFDLLVRSERRRRSLFDSFFDDPFGRTIQKKLSSKPVTIEVLDLPKEGRPKSFNGAVGAFKLTASIDKKSVAINEAVTLKLNLQGKGNIKLAKLPKFSIPADIEQYEPKISSNIQKKSGVISGSKKAEYVLIPRYSGKYKIKPIEFSWFDPKQKKYIKDSVGPFVINVTGNESNVGHQAGNMPSNFTRKEITLLGKDIHFIKETTAFQRRNEKVWNSLSLWVIIGISSLLFMGFYFYDTHKAALNENQLLARRQKAGKEAAKQLSLAKKMMYNAESEAFYKAISAALQKFIQDKLNIELTDFSALNVKKVLQERQIDASVIESYLEILQESDFRQYASFSEKEEDRATVFDKAKNVLTRLEKWI
jgi:hypothetical protein